MIPGGSPPKDDPRGLGPLLGALHQAASAAAADVWFVGGTVRDRFLGRASPDVDVVAAGDVRALAADVADRAGKPWFALSHEFGAYRVVGEGAHLDLAGLRGGGLEADLALRDFTMNAVALPVTGGPVVDPFGGLDDLRAKRLVPVSARIFEDDPIRLLRAPRFAHTLGLRTAPELEDLVRREARRLPQAAAERILAEIALTLDAGRSAAALCLWDSLGLLQVVFPEVARLRGVGQSDFHHLDALGHTQETAERLDEILDSPGLWFPSAWEPLTERLTEPVDGVFSRAAALRLAAFLHDSGKAETRSVQPDGRVLFWGHTQRGASLATEVCVRLRCSSAVTSLITTVVREHLGLGVLERQEGPPPRDVVRYLWATAPWEPEALILSLADRLATRGPRSNEEHVRSQRTLADRLMAAWHRRRVDPPRPPVTGDDLMAALGLPPGPLLGEVVREVALSFESGEASSGEQALEVARRYLEARTSPSAD
jgi:poly(A) polymerase